MSAELLDYKPNPGTLLGFQCFEYYSCSSVIDRYWEVFMPYFVYRVSPQRFIKYLEQYPEYQDARKYARDLRAGQNEEDLDTIKIIFATEQAEAEALLKAKRERQPSEDD